MNLLLLAVLVEVLVVLGGQERQVRLRSPQTLGQREVLGMLRTRGAGDVQGLERRRVGQGQRNA